MYFSLLSMAFVLLPINQGFYILMGATKGSGIVWLL